MCSAVSLSWLTPNTTVRSTPLPGAEISTFLAPASICFWHARAIGEEAGAFEHDVDAQFRVRQIGRIALGGDADALAVDDEVVALGRDRAGIFAVDAVALNSQAFDLASARSLIATSSRPLSARSSIARATRRPMRPKPLIATFTVIADPLRRGCRRGAPTCAGGRAGDSVECARSLRWAARAASTAARQIDLARRSSHAIRDAMADDAPRRARPDRRARIARIEAAIGGARAAAERRARPPPCRARARMAEAVAALDDVIARGSRRLMAEVTLTIGGRRHTVACRDGEEAQLRRARRDARRALGDRRARRRRAQRRTRDAVRRADARGRLDEAEQRPPDGRRGQRAALDADRRAARRRLPTALEESAPTP